MQGFSFFFLGNLLDASAGAQTPVYRCIDERGHLAYQAQPCANAKSARRLDLPAHKPNEGLAVPAVPASALTAKEPNSSSRPALAILQLSPASQRTFNPVGAKLAFEKAMAERLRRHKELCKSAGKTISSSVNDVRGIRLDTMHGTSGHEDPAWRFASIPEEMHGENFVASFLDSEFHDPDTLGGMTVRTLGCQQMDVRQADGSYLRHQLSSVSAPTEGKNKLPIVGSQAARYAVSIEALASAADRQLWVAGSRIVVTDTQTRRVIGEQRSYSFALPSKATGADLNRRNWLNKLSCPKYSDKFPGMTRVALIGFIDPSDRTMAKNKPLSNSHP